MSDRGIPTVVADLLRAIRRALGRFETERTHVNGTYKAEWGQLTIVVEEDELDGGWIAECVDLPGCVAQGETKDEALHNLSDAVAAVIGVKVNAVVNKGPAARKRNEHERDTYEVAL